jgi:hypothetical protein
MTPTPLPQDSTSSLVVNECVAPANVGTLTFPAWAYTSQPSNPTNFGPWLAENVVIPMADFWNYHFVDSSWSQNIRENPATAALIVAGSIAGIGAILLSGGAATPVVLAIAKNFAQGAATYVSATAIGNAIQGEELTDGINVNGIFTWGSIGAISSPMINGILGTNHAIVSANRVAATMLGSYFSFMGSLTDTSFGDSEAELAVAVTGGITFAYTNPIAVIALTTILSMVAEEVDAPDRP